MKNRLELNSFPDGSRFLNYWDAAHGRDVVCEVVGGRLYLHRHAKNGDKLTRKRIGLETFLKMVERNAKKGAKRG